MLLVGIDDSQPLNEGVADGGVLNHPAHLVEIGFVVQRINGALQPLAIVERTEVVETSGNSCTVFEFVHRERHAENLS